MNVNSVSQIILLMIVSVYAHNIDCQPSIYAENVTLNFSIASWPAWGVATSGRWQRAS